MRLDMLGDKLVRSIILIELPWGRDKDPRVPLGHASLLASLQKFGKGEVISIVAPINDPSTDSHSLKSRILKLSEVRGDLDLAIGAYVWAEDIIKELLVLLRASGFTGRIILGGPQISYTPCGLEELYPEADIFVRGYGEMAIVGLFNYPEMTSIEGAHFAGQTDLNLQTSVDLSVLPSPWLSGAIDPQGQRFIRWETQRGCSFRCSFCQHKEAGMRLVRRELDEARIMAEIDLFCRSGVEEIAVLDPIFNSGPQAKSILQRFINNGFTGKLALQCRAEMCDDEFLEMASNLDVKFEFGLQTIHPAEWKAVNRPNSMRKVNEVFDKMNSMDLDYEVSIIFGLPNQTLSSFQGTVDWCLRKKVPVIKAFPLMLLRGTEVEQRRDEWGLVESDGSMPVVLESDTFSQDDWHRMFEISDLLKETEGKHPETVQNLTPGNEVRLEFGRFMPFNRMGIAMTNLLMTRGTR